ncbi:MAG: hypothetical protein AAF790_01795 [Planctomycetota bacterium]
MPTLPTLPPEWDGYHPLVVHFPIALFVVAPLFVGLAMLTGSRAMMVSALLLLLMGVAGAFVATDTGNAAYDAFAPDEYSELLDPDYEYDLVTDAHKKGTEFARNIFAGIAAVYLMVVIVAYAKPSSVDLKPRFASHLVVLGLLGWGNLVMANAAHLGGELVHIYGVRANMGEPTSVDGQEEDSDDWGDEESDDESDDDWGDGDGGDGDSDAGDSDAGDSDDGADSGDAEAGAEDGDAENSGAGGEPSADAA